MENKRIEHEGLSLSKIVWTLGVLIVGLLITKIFLTNQLATTGAVATAHSNELEALKVENQRLQNEVSLLGSIASLSEKANKLGLKNVSKVEIIRSTSNVAFQP